MVAFFFILSLYFCVVDRVEHHMRPENEKEKLGIETFDASGSVYVCHKLACLSY